MPRLARRMTDRHVRRRMGRSRRVWRSLRRYLAGHGRRRRHPNKRQATRLPAGACLGFARRRGPWHGTAAAVPRVPARGRALTQPAPRAAEGLPPRGLATECRWRAPLLRPQSQGCGGRCIGPPGADGVYGGATGTVTTGTARCGPACRVVWAGGANHSPRPDSASLNFPTVLRPGQTLRRQEPILPLGPTTVESASRRPATDLRSYLLGSFGL